MVKVKKGQKLECIPCGREVIVDTCGVSKTTIWCCGKPMKSVAKTAKRKTAKRKTTKKAR